MKTVKMKNFLTELTRGGTIIGHHDGSENRETFDIKYKGKIYHLSYDQSQDSEAWNYRITESGKLVDQGQYTKIM